MYVRVRVLGDADCQTYYINCRSINESMDELREKVAQKLNYHNKSLVRLFFDGNELNNGYSLYEYKIKLNNVIHVMLRPECAANNDEKDVKCVDHSMITQTSNDTNNDGYYKDENVIQEDDYYCVGDYVDGLDAETGAWFEGKIAGITSNCKTYEHKYYVNFDKQSIGSHIGLELQKIRPQSTTRIPIEDIKEGDVVLGNFNNDNYRQRGYWFECRIEKKLLTKRKFFATIYLADTVLNGQKLYFIDELYRIERSVQIRDRSPDIHLLVKIGSKTRRQTPPDCTVCEDNPSVNCTECSCNECGAKTEPDKQIICDECNAIYHIWCLEKPLKTVPDGDWYCDKCVNTDQNQLIRIQTNQLKLRQNRLNGSGVKQWGRGMACVGRTRVCDTVGKHHLGPIPGVEVGMWWRFRFQASEAGVHSPLVAGIHGKENFGAYSVVFSCSYAEDIDLGLEFYYTASGGKESGGKCRVGGPQVKNQELKRCNKALALNCFAEFNGQKGANAGHDWQLGAPVRVLRSGNARGAAKRSLYLPKVGVRYDGIYKVVKYWPQTGESGYLVWRYVLRRDDPSPPPWTTDGRNRTKRLGLHIIYPDGWTQETASKRSYQMDAKAFKHKIPKLTAFSIPKSILDLINLDTINRHLWQTVLLHTKDGKQKFIESLEINFKCVYCLDLVKSPVTTHCSHNICKQCLQQSFKSGIKLCPICRSNLKSCGKLLVNKLLKQILTKLLFIK